MSHSKIVTIEDFQKETRRLSGILAENISDDYYPRSGDGQILTFDQYPFVTFNGPRGDATPFIELKDGVFNFVLSERGTEFRRIKGDADKILFLVFEGLANELASGYAARNRIEGQDFRRLMFAKSVELLNLLNPEWAARKTRLIEAVLRKNPFEDK